MNTREVALRALSALDSKDMDAMEDCISMARSTARGTIIGMRLNDAVAAADDALLWNCYGRELHARSLLNALV